MKLILMAVAFLSWAPDTGRAQENFFYARLTFYHDKVPTASGSYPREGETVAAEKSFKFGTKLEIPALSEGFGDGIFVVRDRGLAVERRTASRGKLPVIDVYVSSNSRVRALAATKKYHMVKVYVR